MQKLGEDVKDAIVKYYGKESNSNIAELLVKQNQLKGHDQNTSKKRVSYFVSSMKKRRRERSYNFAETLKTKGVTRDSSLGTSQSETGENLNYFGQLKQLSDQQNIHALGDKIYGQAVSYAILNTRDF